MESLADYNNNPGNLRPPKGVTYEGQIGVDDKGFAIFETPAAGRQALLSELAQLEGVPIDAAIEVAKLTRLAVLYIVKPVAQLFATIAGDALGGAPGFLGLGELFSVEGGLGVGRARPVFEFGYVALPTALRALISAGGGSWARPTQPIGTCTTSSSPRSASRRPPARPAGGTGKGQP